MAYQYWIFLLTLVMLVMFMLLYNLWSAHIQCDSETKKEKKEFASDANSVTLATDLVVTLIIVLIVFFVAGTARTQ